MDIWLIQLGEPVPTDGAVRLQRTGILATYLIRRRHQVTWWAPTFDHVKKTQRYESDTRVDVESGYRIEFLHSSGYKKNLSISRVIYHYDMARKFQRRIQVEQQPDIILASIPAPELAHVAVNYGFTHGVPVVLDVMDVWPDVFLRRLPGFARWLGHLGLGYMHVLNRSIFPRARGIFGISKEYLDWGLAHARKSAGEFDGVFYLGYPKHEVAPQERGEAEERWRLRGLRKNAFICLFLGTFNHYFDLSTVIRAARDLERTCGGFQFVLCGHGPDLARCKQMADGTQSILFPGWIGLPDIQYVLKSASVGLAPYASHAAMSLPNKPFEYLSSGLPVLSTLQGELAHILAEHRCGVTYQAGDVEGLKRSLSELRANQRYLEELSSNATIAHVERFSADRVYAEMVGSLERVAAG